MAKADCGSRSSMCRWIFGMLCDRHRAALLSEGHDRNCKVFIRGACTCSEMIVGV